MEPKKLIIFDIDGTLTNTKAVEERCYIQAFEKTFGLEIVEYNWDNLKNVTDWGICEEMLFLERGIELSKKKSSI